MTNMTMTDTFDRSTMGVTDPTDNSNFAVSDTTDMSTMGVTDTTDFQIYQANDWKEVYGTTRDLMVYIEGAMLDLDNAWGRCMNSDHVNLLCFTGVVFDPNQSGLPRSRHKFCVSLNPDYKVIAAHDIRIGTKKSHDIKINTNKSDDIKTVINKSQGIRIVTNEAASEFSHLGLIHCLCFILVNKLFF